MRCLPLVIGVIGVVAAFTSGASAQSINLTGTYRCIQDCRDGHLGTPAFVTQNGWNLNLVTETGESYRAWPDLAAPYGRIWIEARNESAVYSPDGCGFSSTTAGSGSATSGLCRAVGGERGSLGQDRKDSSF